MTMRPGQTRLHYRLIDQIGEGGMGVLFRGRTTCDVVLIQDSAERFRSGDSSRCIVNGSTRRLVEVGKWSGP